MGTRNSSKSIGRSETRPSNSQAKSEAQEGKRGFAAMNQQLQRAIASKGGQAAHQKGTAHEFDSEEARLAGQKGGTVVSRDRDHMAEIGRRGGESRQAAQRDDDRSSPERSGKTMQKTSRIKPGNR